VNKMKIQIKTDHLSLRYTQDDDCCVLASDFKSAVHINKIDF
jgi:hypothetical protein